MSDQQSECTPTLRDRIAEALVGHLARTADIRPGRDGVLAFVPEITDVELLCVADAILAVLPPARLVPGTTDQQPATAHGIPVPSDPLLTATPAEEIALLRLTLRAVEEGRAELRTELARLRAQLWKQPAPVDRAAVLREAANAVDHLRATMLAPTVRDCYANGLGGAAARLRRMADEAQQPECACDPAPHREEDGTYSHWAGCPVADAQQQADTRCDVTFIGGGRCEKDAGHRDGRWPNDPHVPAPAADQPDTETEADTVVAYRDPRNSRVLLCREHGERWQGVVPVTSEDLPDGGTCTFGRLSSLTCGRDVLATPDTE